LKKVFVFCVFFVVLKQKNMFKKIVLKQAHIATLNVIIIVVVQLFQRLHLVVICGDFPPGSSARQLEQSVAQSVLA